MAHRSQSSHAFINNAIAFILILIGCFTAYEVFVPTDNYVAGNSIGTASMGSLFPGMTIEQAFKAPFDHLSGLQIMFSKADQSHSSGASLSWEIVSAASPEAPLAGGVIDVDAISDGALYTLQFPEIRSSFLQSYRLLIKTDSLPEGISIRKSPLTQSASLAYFVNGSEQAGTLTFSMKFTRDFMSLRALLILLLIAILLWLAFVEREKIWRSLNAAPLARTVSICIAVFGILFLILEPPLQMPDEVEHFRRTWGVAEGQIFPANIEGIISTPLPQYIQNTIDRISKLDRASQNPVQLVEMLLESPGDTTLLSSAAAPSSAYNFFAYLLPAALVRLGIWQGSSALGLLLLARFANLLQYLLLTAWALNNAKIGKYTLAAMALIGFIVTQGTAISVDSLLMGGSFLFITSVVNLAYAGSLSRAEVRSEIGGLIVGALCILIAKFVYLPLLGLVLLIPAAKFGSRNRKTAFLTAFGLAALAFTLGLYLLTPQGIDPRLIGMQIDMAQQAAYLLGTPFTWLRVMFETIRLNALSYYVQFTWINGTNETIGVFSVVQLVLVLFFAWSESHDLWHKLKASDYWLIGAVTLLTTLAILLPLYLAWTPVGAAIVKGTQGRYFIPVACLLLMTIKPSFAGMRKQYSALLVLSMGFLLFTQLWTTVGIFY